ncbi:uncharacterized protein LOC134834083 [Culicoides brevitarsis]|uniref:uncharacterized protein LOC134834083 n=1 Tax=Culicoides brevitarsis TaxID=469753 RepID=UPI00307BC898
MRHRRHPYFKSFFYDPKITGWYFLAFDYNTHRKKLLDIMPLLGPDQMLKLRENGVKYDMLGDNGEIDFCITDMLYISEIDFQLCYLLEETFTEHDLDFNKYLDSKYFALTTRMRGYEPKFYGLQENYYAISYDGDPEGKEQITPNGCLITSYDAKVDVPKSKVNYELQFDFSEKQKALKAINGEVLRKKTCREMNDAEYFDLVNTEFITCRHIIHYFLLQTMGKSFEKPESTEFINKEGDYYPINKLSDIRKYVPWDIDNQYMILVTCDDPDSRKICQMSVNYVEQGDHFMYYFHERCDPKISCLRIVPVPKVNVDPYERQFFGTKEDEERHNGFLFYGHGVIFAGRQDNPNILHRAMAQKEKIAIPDEVIPKTARGYGINQTLIDDKLYNVDYRKLSHNEIKALLQ